MLTQHPIGMKFKTLSLNNLKIVELAAFTKPCLISLNKLDCPNAKLADKINEQKILFDNLKRVMCKPNMKEATKTLRLADKKRKNALRAFKHYVKAQLLDGNEQTAAHADQIFLFLKKIGPQIASMGLIKETGTIEMLHQHFTSIPCYVKSVAAIGANELWARVYDAQLLFENLYNERQQLRFEFRQTESASKAADKVRQKWADIFAFIQSAYTIEERPEYLNITTIINVEIDSTMKKLHSRTTKAAKARKKKQKKVEV